MKNAIALAALFAMLSAQAQVPSGHNAPLRNTFVTAAETVIDNASRVDLKADLTVSDAQMKQVDSAKATLNNMVEDDREKDAAAVVNDMVFQLSACRLQAQTAPARIRARPNLVVPASARWMPSTNIRVATRGLTARRFTSSPSPLAQRERGITTLRARGALPSAWVD